MKRSRHVWILFVLCLAVVLAAMAWISRTALDARRQAALEENVRLALWRMDFALAPVLARFVDCICVPDCMCMCVCVCVCGADK